MKRSQQRVLSKLQRKQVPKIVQITQNKSLKLKPNPMTYNPHQDSTFKGNISRIMRKLQTMHSFLAHTHSQVYCTLKLTTKFDKLETIN